MPELPEVEVLVRHLAPLLQGKTIRKVEVHRAKVLAPTSVRRFKAELCGATFAELSRRGKYLVFNLKKPTRVGPLQMLGHLGMTGRMYLQPATASLPKHAPVVLDVGREKFVFEDTRYFGRLSLDCSALQKLGPEPLGPDFTCQKFAETLRRSRQPVKIKLLDQTVVAGVGNIYASECLFRAGVAPGLPAHKLSIRQTERLWEAIREVLANAIDSGSTVPLDYNGSSKRDRLFYFGRAAEAPDFYSERLEVYDREHQPCLTCGTAIRRRIQAARSTFYCPKCQRR